ncbi:hypothetical protein [Neobacillus dielmonensis]|uniref:hypothetical protein n=1 Tax=Neobacillus dielmonensis TaxID=1347369 RepID=UPI0005AB7D2D|nr:hypothetical protein [Neobacillus dielmonensis]
MQPAMIKIPSVQFIWILPFSYQATSLNDCTKFLNHHGFLKLPSNLGRVNDGTYPHSGPFFLPMTNHFLFPETEQSKGFHGYEKKLDLMIRQTIKEREIPFQIDSIEFVFCPFEIGFLTIRTQLNDLPFQENLNAANQFRALLQDRGAVHGIRFNYDNKEITTTSQLLGCLVLGLPEFLLHHKMSYEPSSLVVQSLFCFEKETPIGENEVYLAASLGADLGSSKDYITDFIKKHSYRHWMTDTWLLSDDTTFSCLTTGLQEKDEPITIQFLGPMYYALLITMFHRQKLLQLIEDYANIRLDQDKQKIKQLIYTMDSFTSNFFFTVQPADRTSREIYQLIQTGFQIQPLYKQIKEAQVSLFNFEETSATKRDSFLLLVLTIYTVFCGIFSMNLFAHDLVGNIHWEKLKSYNPFEYLAVLIVFSGLVVVTSLFLQSLYQGIRNKINQKKWTKETVLSSKKRS